MTDPLEDRRAALADALVASYETDRRTERLDREFLPDRARIVGVFEQIRNLLFPGFFAHAHLSRQSVRGHVSEQLDQIGQTLAEQIDYCSRMGSDGTRAADAAGSRREARRRAAEFLARLPALRDLLALDAQAAFDGDPAAKSIDEVIYCYPGFYAVTVYRVAHELHLLGAQLLARILTEHAHSVTGTDIHPGAQIGKSFFIDHATGVIIGETTAIGDNVKLYQGVTLGARSFPKDERGRVIKGRRRHPTIEDNVTIYANATILGGRTVIGRGATVNGNVFVTRSIDAESTVTSEHPHLRVRPKRPERE